MNLSYRQEDFSNEVVLLLQKIVKSKQPLLLWQAHAKSKAQAGIAIDLDTTKKTLDLSFSKQMSELDLTQPIYCKGDQKQIVFKSTSFECERSNLRLTIPNDIRLQELREAKRFEVYNNKKAFITVTIPSHYESKVSSYIFKLNEVSEYGCSVLMHSSSLKQFHVGDNLKLTAIGSDVVYIPFKAQIKYITPMGQKGQAEVQLYKVGMQFEDKLNFYSYYLTRHLKY
jgi:hypothetical protein